MKKTKLLKCLLPLLGVSALTIVPILSTACANGVINNQTQSVNETLVDEVSSSASGSSTQTGSTSTSVVDKYYESKKIENLNILKNIKWFYKNPHSKPDILDDKNQIDLDLSPSNLDWAISGVYDLNSGNNIITDMQNGSATLGFYPYVKLGKNQYTPFNPVTTTTDSGSSTTTTTIKNQWYLPNENLMLKGKILTMDYFIPEVTIYKEPEPTLPASRVDSPTPMDKLDNYKLAINKLTLSDSTTEFPNGDPRTIATLEVPKTNSKSNKVNWDEVKTNTPSLQILDIKRPNPQAIIDVLNEYQKVITDNPTGIQTVKTYLESVKTNDSQYENKFVPILSKFSAFATINANNVDALKDYLALEDADIFSVVIDHILDNLFNLDSEQNKLFKTFDDILKSLDDVIKTQQGQQTLYLLAESTTTETATQVAENIKSLVKTMATYYLSFAHTLYDLVSSCVKPNWLLPPSIIESQK